jgi:cation transport regulator ChaC
MRISAFSLHWILLILSYIGWPYSLAFQASASCFRHNLGLSTTDRNRKQSSLKMSTEERTVENTPRWDPEQQIYVGGIIPENAEVRSLIEKNNGYLRLFGYGSLCWNPGTGPLARPGVVGALGRARGYKRCWAQKSSDHRGRPSFPGIVCTLLEDKEVYEIRKSASEDAEDFKEPTMTEGVIYLIPPELVDECLQELDFREKGGYARDVIDVVEDETGDTHQALLYRGTPDNPAMWNRALLDVPFAAGA